MSELFYGTCIQLDDRHAVLVRGPSASGKSDLALRLINEGGVLVSDDQVELSVRNHQLLANAPEKIKGKLEIRGVGIQEYATAENAPIKLIIDLLLENDPARLPEKESETIMGIDIPHAVLYPFEISSTIKLRALLGLK